MNTVFDHHDINHMTVAVGQEMAPRSSSAAEPDTLFLGGCRPTSSDEVALANFGLSKNWQIIFPVFDPANTGAGPVGFHAVVTDGLKQATAVGNGRLWKRDRRSQAVLVFPDIKAVAKIRAKGRFVVREARGQFHDHGYDLAIEAVRQRAARRPGKAPVVSTIGALPVVMDVRALAKSFELAE